MWLAATASACICHIASALGPDADVLIIRELRSMANDARKRLKNIPRVNNEAQKWLEWPEFLHVVAELRQECAATDSHGKLRKRNHVAWSLQRYLIFAILSCVPGVALQQACTSLVAQNL